MTKDVEQPISGHKQFFFASKNTQEQTKNVTFKLKAFLYSNINRNKMIKYVPH
jgi:hypothetical protein